MPQAAKAAGKGTRKPKAVIVRTVTGLTTLGSIVLAEITWANDAEIPARVNVKNLCRVKDGVMIDPD